MNTPERQFWRLGLRGGFRALGHCCRLESHATALGMPDINLKVDGVDHDWWIEIKVTEYPGTEVVIRPAQWQWHKRRRKAGGRTMFIVKWNRPYGIIHTVNTTGPMHEDGFDLWSDQAALIMDDEINWRKLIEVLNGK
jgi:hypothetical protein